MLPASSSGMSLMSSPRWAVPPCAHVPTERDRPPPGGGRRRDRRAPRDRPGGRPVGFRDPHVRRRGRAPALHSRGPRLPPAGSRQPAAAAEDRHPPGRRDRARAHRRVACAPRGRAVVRRRRRVAGRARRARLGRDLDPRRRVHSCEVARPHAEGDPRGGPVPPTDPNAGRRARDRARCVGGVPVVEPAARPVRQRSRSRPCSWGWR